MTAYSRTTVSRTVIYFAMLVMLAVILFGAYGGAHPTMLAVGLIGELILVSTAHLSSVIEQHGVGNSGGPSSR